MKRTSLFPPNLCKPSLNLRSRIYRLPYLDAKVEWIKVLVLHFQITAGVGLLATGASGLQSTKPSATDHTLVKIGIAILTVAWAVVSGWAARTLFPGNVAHTRAQRLATRVRPGQHVSSYTMRTAVPTYFVHKLIFIRSSSSNPSSSHASSSASARSTPSRP